MGFPNPVKEAKKWFNRIKDAGKDGVGLVKGEATKQINDIKTEGESVAHQVERSGRSAVDHVKDAVREAEGKIKSAAQKAESEAIEAIHDAEEAIIEGFDTLQDLIESGILEKALHEFIKLVKKAKFTETVQLPIGPIILVLINPDEKLDVLDRYATNIPSKEAEIRQMVKDLQPASIRVKPIPILPLQGGWDTSGVSDKVIDEIFDSVKEIL